MSAPKSAPRRVQKLITHRFAIGQLVRYRDKYRTPGAGFLFRVTATLPERENSPQYRIRSEAENYERVTMEENLDFVPTKTF
jgi:hypothetical protein